MLAIGMQGQFLKDHSIHFVNIVFEFRIGSPCSPHINCKVRLLDKSGHGLGQSGGIPDWNKEPCFIWENRLTAPRRIRGDDSPPHSHSFKHGAGRPFAIGW